jgi:hypothetical protein
MCTLTRTLVPHGGRLHLEWIHHSNGIDAVGEAPNIMAMPDSIPAPHLHRHVMLAQARQQQQLPGGQQLLKGVHLLAHLQHSSTALSHLCWTLLTYMPLPAVCKCP